MREWLKVVDENGMVREKWEVCLYDGKYTVFTPIRMKTYKTLKSAEKFLAQYNLKIA